MPLHSALFGVLSCSKRVNRLSRKAGSSRVTHMDIDLTPLSCACRLLHDPTALQQHCCDCQSNNYHIFAALFQNN